MSFKVGFLSLEMWMVDGGIWGGGHHNITGQLRVDGLRTRHVIVLNDMTHSAKCLHVSPSAMSNRS